AAEQLRGHLENLRRLMKSDPELWAVASEVTLRSARDAAVGEIVQRSHDQWFGFLRDLVAEGVAEGALRRDLDPDGAAACLIAAIQGASMPSIGTFRPERVDLVFDQLERWLGVRPAAEPDNDEGEPHDDGTGIAERPAGQSGHQQSTIGLGGADAAGPTRANSAGAGRS
ncbi:MAG TPA: TetR family transcriptional regulator C-terminal domain-containing protein, partial [Thermomicrobiales bacterium]|nr:TetR family transcriptional regulator C-terminal domain-containing protein [Thermomicrobiales bacterium]